MISIFENEKGRQNKDCIFLIKFHHNNKLQARAAETIFN